ncbi:hypothetical protein PVL29_020470 [Vitis rotundifolia]|uniref:Cytochrome P450 n=1 Tax=Vitis rotundifolia TaxID=103349 RepID=A0AA38YX41_VITRO|nr:hypothetical protein PVL29_020470 [Vitis rotundifolia]
METWFGVLVSLCIAAFFFPLLFSKPKKKLPPRPFAFPIISSYLWLRKSYTELEPILRNLHAKHGPIVSLPLGNSPAIFVASASLANEALVQIAAVFAHRPVPPVTNKVIGSNQHNVSSAGYGPTWRLLRRNLTTKILNPLRLKAYSRAHKWVLEILFSRLRRSSETGDGVVRVVDDFHFAMFCLLVLMSFGDQLVEEKVREIEAAQLRVLAGFGKILFRKRWEKFLQLRKHQEDVLIPLIRSTLILCWICKKRKLNDSELVSLCSEFLNAGTHTTYTSLQWIMANLVKYHGVMGTREDEVKQEDLQKMPYLKAVILEGLRRHPPGHFGLPHAVNQDVNLGGYIIPRNANIFFMVAEIAWNPGVWEDPLEFKPERFLTGDGVEAFNVTGSKEIKMMPFGAGRRVCPGNGLRIFHLEYFVANLVWKFKWTAVDGDDVDLSEKKVSALLPVLMQNPLKAHISPRAK